MFPVQITIQPINRLTNNQLTKYENR